MSVLGVDDLVDFMRRSGIRGEVLMLKDGMARTSELAARSLGCDVSCIAKNVVLESRDGDILIVIISGDKRVDLKKLCAIVGKDFELASRETVLRETGFEVGGVPPFGHIKKIRTLIDKSIERFDFVYTSAGSKGSILRISVDELKRTVGSDVVDVSR